MDGRTDSFFTSFFRPPEISSFWGFQLPSTPLGITTLLHRSSPDISFGPSSLAISCSWKMLQDLGSDHLPILLTIPHSTVFCPNERPPSFNFQKVRWKAKAEAWQATCSSLSPKSNPKFVYSLLRFIAGSSSSSCSYPNFPNCSSPRESASVFANYMRSHFSVSQSKALHRRATGYFSELRRATCPE